MDNDNTILVVDDDKNILTILTMYLKKEGFNVLTCERGDMVVDAYMSCEPCLVVLDVMLPGMDGRAVLTELRKLSDTPVIMLTAKGDTMDRIQGLNLGADDYMVKPFDAKELIARINAVLRRTVVTDITDTQSVTIDSLYISLENYSVTIDGQAIEMTPKEIELLYYLATSVGKVFTREQLLEQVWGFDYYGDSRTVDVHIKRIREKIGPDYAQMIKTVWGVGYRFVIGS
ncbi:MAG: response regulator transcription factor [Clostridia bacterium]